MEGKASQYGCYPFDALPEVDGKGGLGCAFGGSELAFLVFFLESLSLTTIHVHKWKGCLREAIVVEQVPLLHWVRIATFWAFPSDKRVRCKLADDIQCF